MIAQWDMLKDPSDANLKELYTKWRSLLTQDTTLPTTQIPEPEKLAKIITVKRLLSSQNQLRYIHHVSVLCLSYCFVVK